MTSARALSTAFELSLIDILGSRDVTEFTEIKRLIPLEDGGLRLLLGLLAEGGVVLASDNHYCLTPAFAAALKYRDLLVAKLDFAHIAAHDFIDSFSYLLVNPQEFRKRSGMFRLFNYGNALVSNPENRRLTERWLRITSALTRYESHVCFASHSFAPYRRMLDIGGNSGEFALQACRAHPGLTATVLDLPVVCDIGVDHVHDEPESKRIDFISGDARTDTLPSGFDLITFKSMLHDWPEVEVRTFLYKACNALELGGTLLIFERGRIDFDQGPLSYATLPLLLFAHTLRSPDLYRRCLVDYGLQQVSVQWIRLEVPFFIVSGVKTG
jgi:SAM-dependent methyltransferase